MFGLENKSGKTLSICLAADESYLLYRFGSKGKIELEYPAHKSKKPNEAFKYRWFSRGGGPENLAMHDGALTFELNGFKYEVFDWWDSETNSSGVGINVTNLSTMKTSVIKGVNRFGSLMNLRDFLENPF